MLNEAQISLAGYVATQPVTKSVGGNANVSMRVAWTPRRQDRVTGEWVDSNTSYVTVICWRKLAVNVGVCVRKGDPVVVKGKLSVRTYDDRQGVRRTVVEVDASSVGHDLSRGVAAFQRVRPPTGMTASEYAASQEPGQGTAGAGGEVGPVLAGSVLAGSVLAGSSSAAGGSDGWVGPDSIIPMPAEPDESFFDEAAIDQVGADVAAIDEGGLGEGATDEGAGDQAGGTAKLKPVPVPF
ncbi:MAG TPA: single-stranded DNA-binding protein [Streptosporangiaceae bacterium]|nr:single-stranded DNA-binding protein [Streptosporangiaceae bacterium]